MPDSVRWYLTLVAITVAFAPFARWLAGRLPSQGAFFAKPVGLLATVWPLWFVSSVLPVPYTAGALWAIVIAGGTIGWARLYLRGEIDRAWIQRLIVAEAITLAAFIGYCWLRGYTPAITGTEKPMDLALMSASASSTEMPPLDPWMAGQRINYYYLGYLLHGSLARMSQVPTWIGFNFALASTFAMAVITAAGVGYDIVRDRIGGRAAAATAALASFFVVIAGNMRTPAWLLQDPRGTWDAGWWMGIGWNSSRVVQDTSSGFAETINEFPSFSFILGDLHPHVMALPFTLVSISLALNLLRSRRARPIAVRTEVDAPVRPGILDQIRGDSQWWLRLAATGAVIGALYPLNSWDFPTYLAAAGIALILARGWERETFVEIAGLGLAALIGWLPFWLSFVPFAGGGGASAGAFEGVPVLSRIAETIGVYNGERTSVPEFLSIFGLPWLVTTLFVGTLAWRHRRVVEDGQRRLSGTTISIIAGAGIIALAVPMPVMVFAGIPLALGLWLVLDRLDRPAEPSTVIAGLVAAGCGLILLTEFIFIKDVFNGRMNTLFKVYYQAWTLLGIATAVAFVLAWRFVAERSPARVIVGVGMAAAVVAGLCYPVLSARAWTVWNGPREWVGMDGSAFVQEAQPGDMEAIRWLQANAKAGDVILESPGCSYQVNGGVPIGRFAAFTGVPTLIGWGGHEDQWRGGQSDLQAQIRTRQQDVAAIYADPQSPLVDQYGVTLMAVGVFEQEGAGDCQVAGPFANVSSPSFPGPGWTEVFNQDGTRIYRRDGS